MSGIWCAVRVDCVISVTVVSDHNNLITVCLCSSNNLLYAAIYSLYSLLDSLIDTCVANHITICEVEADEVILLLTESNCKLICNLVCAHLWLEVIGSNLWRCNEDTILICELCLATTIEEECYMCVLLSLSNTEL